MLQMMCAEVDEGRADPVVLKQIMRRLGNNDLAAVPRRANPGATMYTKTDVTLGGCACLAGMDTNSDANGLSQRPGVRCQRRLGILCGANSVPRTMERDEKRVTLRVDFITLIS